jgi:hypothetical protein
MEPENTQFLITKYGETVGKGKIKKGYGECYDVELVCENSPKTMIAMTSFNQAKEKIELLLEEKFSKPKGSPYKLEIL